MHERYIVTVRQRRQGAVEAPGGRLIVCSPMEPARAAGWVPE